MDEIQEIFCEKMIRNVDKNNFNVKREMLKK